MGEYPSVVSVGGGDSKTDWSLPIVAGLIIASVVAYLNRDKIMAWFGGSGDSGNGSPASTVIRETTTTLIREGGSTLVREIQNNSTIKEISNFTNGLQTIFGNAVDNIFPPDGKSNNVNYGKTVVIDGITYPAPYTAKSTAPLTTQANQSMSAFGDVANVAMGAVGLLNPAGVVMKPIYQGAVDSITNFLTGGVKKTPPAMGSPAAGPVPLTKMEQQAFEKPLSLLTENDKLAQNEANKRFAVQSEITRVFQGMTPEGVAVYQNYSSALDGEHVTAVNTGNMLFVSGLKDVIGSYLGMNPSILPGTVEYETRINAANSFLGLNLNPSPDGIRRTGLGTDAGYFAAPNQSGISGNGLPWYSDSKGNVSFFGTIGMSPAELQAEVNAHTAFSGVQVISDGQGGGGPIGSPGSAMASAMSASIASGSSYQDALNDWARSD